MTVDELIKKIKDDYDEEVARKRFLEMQNTKLPAYKQLLAAQEISARTGLTAAEVSLKHLDKMYPDGRIPEAEARKIIVDSLEHNYNNVARLAENAQKKVLKEAGVGINPVVPAFNKDRAEGIAINLAGAEDFHLIEAEFIKNMQNHSQNIVDESVKQNARVHQQLGLAPRVTRRYGGKGVHNGKDPCEWCLERCGEDMPYSEAYAIGAFERHPGCCCELIYKVGKRVERQSDWTVNEWTPIRR